MSTFKNVSGEDRDVLIDGRTIFAKAGAEFTVSDDHDASLVDQPHFELVKGKKPTKGENPTQLDPAAGADETNEGDN